MKRHHDPYVYFKLRPKHLKNTEKHVILILHLSSYHTQTHTCIVTAPAPSCCSVSPTVLQASLLLSFSCTSLSSMRFSRSSSALCSSGRSTMVEFNELGSFRSFISQSDSSALSCRGNDIITSHQRNLNVLNARLR